MAKEKENQLERTRIFLQPIAAPSVLGLYAFAASTFVVSINLAGWYGAPGKTMAELFVIPFIAVFGGLAQLLAGMWAFKARDTLATAVHGMWGSFWIGYGLLFLAFASGVVPYKTGAFEIPIGYWFCTLAVITLTCAVAASAENVAMTAVLVILGVGSALGAIGFFTGLPSVLAAAGWVLLFSALAAWWAATGMMFELAFGRSVLPIGRRKYEEVEPGAGEPAVIHGQ